jgi:hypothetical protein
MPQPCLCKVLLRGHSHPFDSYVLYSPGPVDLRKVGLTPGQYDLTLDCYPELAGVDDILTGQRGLDFARGVGRLARVQEIGTLVVNW